MNTPICDFIQRYIEAQPARLHVPGHKGRGPLGCEAWDITEVDGTDALIAESERNAAALFGTAATFYSAEGSSLCIRAMLYLAMQTRTTAGRPVALAARNAHKAFLYAAALCDFDVEWLYPEATGSVCACPVSPDALAARLDGMALRPFCVYVTSPDYLGGMQDIRGLSAVCRARGVPLIVDNAHGAYLKFLPVSRHPIDLGADMCCDSAHKTLPALTGAAYLHISKAADPRWIDAARDALSLFASTSPSWLILRSLDACNAHLAGASNSEQPVGAINNRPRALIERPYGGTVSDAPTESWPAALARSVARVAGLREVLERRGFRVMSDEPMKLTLVGDGSAIADALRRGGVECEYADAGHVVLMFSPDNPTEDFARIAAALNHFRGNDEPPVGAIKNRPRALIERPYDGTDRQPPRAMTIREAMFAPSEVIPARAALGRVCAAPTVACPPAIPIVVSGEVITEAGVEALLQNGVERVRVAL